MSISGLREKHKQELGNLSLISQPLKPFKVFIIAIAQYLQKSLIYLVTHGIWLMLLVILTVASLILFLSVDGPHATLVEELLEYVRFGLWWVALGVASSIGLGSGLHTFVLYLGPHIAFFTIKAMQCGRVDIKSAIYDTIQLSRSPLWLKKDCSEFGPPLYFKPKWAHSGSAYWHIATSTSRSHSLGPWNCIRRTPSIFYLKGSKHLR